MFAAIIVWILTSCHSFLSTQYKLRHKSCLSSYVKERQTDEPANAFKCLTYLILTCLLTSKSLSMISKWVTFVCIKVFHLDTKQRFDFGSLLANVCKEPSSISRQYANRISQSEYLCRVYLMALRSPLASYVSHTLLISALNDIPRPSLEPLTQFAFSDALNTNNLQSVNGAPAEDQACLLKPISEFVLPQHQIRRRITP